MIELMRSFPCELRYAAHRPQRMRAHGAQAIAPLNSPEPQLQWQQRAFRSNCVGGCGAASRVTSLVLHRGLGFARHGGARVFASQEAGRLLEEGRRKWDVNDKMGALKFWESALNAQPTQEQRRAALYNSTAVHAAFGDVELAQITLREAVQNGLDFKSAVENPTSVDPVLVKLVASQQVLIRLRKFNEATLKAMGGGASPPPFKASSSTGSKQNRPSLLQDDLSDLLDTDMQGIDTSVFGILRRVSLLLLALSALGTLLWFVGLQYLDPQ